MIHEKNVFPQFIVKILISILLENTGKLLNVNAFVEADVFGQSAAFKKDLLKPVFKVHETLKK